MESMESHEVIREAFEKSSPKEIAAEMGLSLSLIYKWAQPNTELGSGSRNPLDRIKELMDLTDEPLLIQWLCQQAGGYFVRNPAHHGDPPFEVLPATNEIIQQFANLISEISEAAMDSHISSEESKDIRKLWDDLKAYTEGFVTWCEKGDFKHLREELEKPRRQSAE